MVKSRSPCLTSAPSRKATDWMAPATRERTCTRSTASRRPEKLSQAVTSRAATTATVTGTAGACAGAEAAVAVALIGSSKNNAEPETDATRPKPAPTRAQRLLLDVISTLLAAQGRRNIRSSSMQLRLDAYVLKEASEMTADVFLPVGR